MVCAASGKGFRAGCIRPANGVYGNPTDNTVGGPLSASIFPTWVEPILLYHLLGRGSTNSLPRRWVPHIVQSFVHGANVAVAHLHHEAALTNEDAPQAGRPFVVTDPNPPISYSDLYRAISTLSVHPFRTITLPPVLIVILSHLTEWYYLLPYRVPLLRRLLPELRGELKHLQPGIISICTHLIASDADARSPVDKGGLGYHGVLTTLEGMVLEILEWNREHESVDGGALERRLYTTSITLGQQLRKVLAADGAATR